jgi:hypothetical protein
MWPLFSAIRSIRRRIKPEIRDGLDGFGLFFAITLFFCLVQATHDGIINRQRAFDDQRWWYPIYRSLGGT